MKRPYLLAAVAILMVSNAWVLAHVTLNRSGPPDSEMTLTARELQYYGGRSDESGATLLLRWTNTAPEYITGLPPDGPAWFDQKKLEELGFEVSVPPGSPQASHVYQNTRSREIFVALEYEGPAWQAWLKEREPRLETDTGYGPQVTLQNRLDIERETTSRLVSIDVARDTGALRRKYPDGRHVMILPALARVKLEPESRASTGAPLRPAFLRGAIIRLAIESINVPQPLSRVLEGQSYSPWTYDGNVVKIQPPPYSVELRVGSKYEPWVVDVKRLR